MKWYGVDAIDTLRDFRIHDMEVFHKWGIPKMDALICFVREKSPSKRMISRKPPKEYPI